MTWTLRPAVPQDAGELWQIDRQVSDYPWSEPQFVSACGGDGGREKSLLAVNDTRCAGFVVYNCVLDEGSIHNIAVLPDSQRQGLARKLLEAALEVMAGENVRRCLLDVRQSNTAARGLYAALGFQLDGIRSNYYRAADSREDALLMSRLV